MRILMSNAQGVKEIAREIIKGCIGKGITAEWNDLLLKSHGWNNVQDQLIKEVANYDHVIIVWSKDYEADPWLQDELFAILSVQRDRGRKFVDVVVADDTPLPVTLVRSDPVQLGEDITASIQDFVSNLPTHNHLFVVMKFNDANLDSTYNTVIKPTAVRLGFQVVRIDELEGSESITREILRHIEGAGVVLCDLTGERPNVYFETGYAMALKKEVILTAAAKSNVHFDLKDRNIIIWATPKDLQDRLIVRLQSIVDRRMARVL